MAKNFHLNCSYIFDTSKFCDGKNSCDDKLSIHVFTVKKNTLALKLKPHD